VEEVRIEVHAGLNVVENWHSGGDFIFYGEGGKIQENQPQEQEIAILASIYCKIAWSILTLSKPNMSCKKKNGWIR
jgi:TnpA family transposase